MTRVKQRCNRPEFLRGSRQSAAREGSLGMTKGSGGRQRVGTYSWKGDWRE